jgi:hypothetical protein
MSARETHKTACPWTLVGVSTPSVPLKANSYVAESHAEQLSPSPDIVDFSAIDAFIKVRSAFNL